jgi:hypothetical protein
VATYTSTDKNVLELPAECPLGIDVGEAYIRLVKPEVLEDARKASEEARFVCVCVCVCVCTCVHKMIECEVLEDARKASKEDLFEDFFVHQCVPTHNSPECFLSFSEAIRAKKPRLRKVFSKPLSFLYT